jgi:CheY-like chemotaxis protein
MERAHTASRQAHVLVVDDQVNIRRTLQDIFVDEGLEVSTASTGEQAIGLCRRNDYDVVLMDVRLPGIDGVEAFREIRRFRSDARIVLMSAYSVDSLIEGALREGADAFVRKPAGADVVLSMIRRSLVADPHGMPS